MPRSVSTISALAFAAIATLAACNSERGEACRMKSDCNGSLICCNAGAPATAGARGACQAECVLPTTDAGVDSGP